MMSFQETHRHTTRKYQRHWGFICEGRREKYISSLARITAFKESVRKSLFWFSDIVYVACNNKNEGERKKNKDVQVFIE